MATDGQDMSALQQTVSWPKRPGHDPCGDLMPRSPLSMPHWPQTWLLPGTCHTTNGLACLGGGGHALLTLGTPWTACPSSTTTKSHRRRRGGTAREAHPHMSHRRGCRCETKGGVSSGPTVAVVDHPRLSHRRSSNPEDPCLSSPSG
jgi:hypothetical protein